jgi:hypothetical protein
MAAVRRRGRITAVGTLALAFALLFPNLALGGAFVLDGAGGPDGRTTHRLGPKVSTGRFGLTQNLFSYDATAGNLRWGQRTGSAWSFATIDGAGGTDGRIDANVGEDQAAVAYDGALHVFYYDRTHGDLRHGWYDGSSWSFETLDGAGGGAGRLAANVGLRLTALNSAGTLHVFYVNSIGDLRHARYDGSSWSFETLDGAGGGGGRIDANVGWNTAAAIFSNKLHVFYFRQDPSCDPVCHLFGSIREASFDGAWTFASVADINCCFVDQSLAAAPFSSSDVTLFYENVGLTTQNLRALHWNGSSWVNLGCVGEPFVQDDIVGANASAATISGQPHVTYYDASSSTLGGTSGVVHSFFDGTTWRTSLVGIHAGAPTASINSGQVKVFVGDASIAAGTAKHDLVLATPPSTGMSVPADTSCG